MPTEIKMSYWGKNIWHISTCIHLPAHPTMTHPSASTYLPIPTWHTHQHLPSCPSHHDTHPSASTYLPIPTWHTHLHLPSCRSHHDTHPSASTYLPSPISHTHTPASTYLPIQPLHKPASTYLPSNQSINIYNLFSTILFPLAELPPPNLHTTSPPQHEKHTTHGEVFGERGKETERACDVSQLDHWRQGIEALDHGSQGVVDAEASEGHQSALRMTCVVYLLHACCSHYMVYHGW